MYKFLIAAALAAVSFASYAGNVTDLNVDKNGRLNVTSNSVVPYENNFDIPGEYGSSRFIMKSNNGLFVREFREFGKDFSGGETIITVPYQSSGILKMSTCETSGGSPSYFSIVYWGCGSSGCNFTIEEKIDTSTGVTGAGGQTINLTIPSFMNSWCASFESYIRPQIGYVEWAE